MTPQELQEQSKKAVIAYLQDSSVRLEYAHKKVVGAPAVWIKNDDNNFNMNDLYFRIAQPRPFYRVFECKDGTLGVVCSKYDNEEIIENQARFSRWLTDRVEYTNE